MQESKDFWGRKSAESNHRFTNTKIRTNKVCLTLSVDDLNNYVVDKQPSNDLENSICPGVNMDVKQFPHSLGFLTTSPIVSG